VFSWPANYDFCYTLAGVISREGLVFIVEKKQELKFLLMKKKDTMSLLGINLARFLS